jgi:hypothetical protein
MHVHDLIPEGADLDDGLGVRGAPWLRRDGAETVGGPARSWGMNQLADRSAGKMCDLAVGDVAKGR